MRITVSATNFDTLHAMRKNRVYVTNRLFADRLVKLASRSLNRIWWSEKAAYQTSSDKPHRVYYVVRRPVNMVLYTILRHVELHFGQFFFEFFC